MVNMAARREQREAVLRFKGGLEDLTFNSKPLIDDLTRAAEASKSQAAEIVETIESRILQARTDWKLPALYLLDSIMKNVGGAYVEESSKVLVSVFCHTFEKLLSPDIRKSLYKLRLTWTPFVPSRKLAAIDRHVHALDPNWPLLAAEASGPSSPTIFVNPKFLEGGSGSKSSDTKSTSGSVSKGTKRPSPSPPKENERETSLTAKVKNMKRIPKISRSPSKSPEKTVTKVEMGGAKAKNAPPLSIQDKRLKILQRVKKEARTLGGALEEEKAVKKGSLSPPGKRRGHSKSPQRTRSVSPMATGNSGEKGKKNSKKVKFSVPISWKHDKAQEGTPPPLKRIKVEVAENSVTDSTDESNKPIPGPIKKSHLNLDDLPPELLPKHQERIKKQVEEHLSSGNLSSEAHQTIVQQLDKLYELQEIKKKNGSSDEPCADGGGHLALVPEGKDAPVDRSDALSKPGGGRERTDMPVDHNGPAFHEPRGRGRGMGPPPPHMHPPPFEPYPPDERGFPPRRGRPPPDHYRGRRPYDRRGGFRPPRGGWMNRERYFDGPPRGRGISLPGLPPPWHDPMEEGGPPFHGPPRPPLLHGPPPHHGPPPPSAGPPPPLPPPPADNKVDVGALLSQLVSTGVIGGSGEGASSQPPPGGRVTPPTMTRQTTPPIAVPHLSLTPATLQQRYTILITLLHSGVPCTSCGLRFKSESTDEYRHHLDWHYQMNRREREGTNKTSRNWYIHPEDWLSFEELTHESGEKEPTLEPQLPEADFREISEQPSAAEQQQEQVSCPVLPGETADEVCSICQEPLEQFWEENDEEWHFKDAMRSESDKLFHVFCYKDAKESGTLDNSGSQLPSPVEIKEENPLISA